MRTLAYTVNLKDDPAIISRYREYHQQVWPEVVASLKQLGIRQLRIWISGRRLFMTMEVPDNFDPATASARHRAKGGRIAEWETLMDTFQERVPEAPGDGTWVEMEQVCSL